MICPNCGQQNMDGSNFCIKCGKELGVVTFAPSQNTVQNTVSQNVTLNNVQPTGEVVSSNVKAHSSVSFKSFFLSILHVFVKPFSSMKEEVSKYSVLKNSIFLSLIVSVIAVLISLVRTMIQAVVVTNYSIFGGSETTWVWENLKNVKYFEVIGKNLLLYLGIIVGIAAVYYIASTLLKKQSDFSRLLAMSALGVVPVYVGTLVLAPILSLMYAPLGMAITLINGLYTFLVLYEAINEEIPLEKKKNFIFIYFVFP